MSEIAPASGEWHRLHPLTILKEIGSLAWALVAAFVFDFGPLPIEVAGTEVVVAVAVFAYAVIRYLFTAYRITAQALELRRGVFVRSFQSMPRQRVQSVNVNTSLSGRFLGVTTVEVSAADAEDIRLAFVSEHAARQLRTVLEAAGSPQGPERSDVHRLHLAGMDPGSLVLFALGESGLAAGAVAVSLAVVAVIGLGWTWAPLAVFPVLWWPLLRTVGLAGFESWVEGDRVRVRAGILGRRESQAPLARIQTLQVSRPLVRRALGHETISVVTGDVAVSADNAVVSGIVAPLEPIGRWREIAQALIGRVAIGETHLHRSSRLTVRRSFVRGSLLAALLAAVLGTGTLVGVVPVSVPLLGVAAALVGAAAYARRRWRILGWAMDEHHLLVRRGVISRHLVVVPVHKVQDVTVRETFFQRRLGLATVEVDTAGAILAGSIRAIDLEVGSAEELAGRMAAMADRVVLPDGV